MGGLIPDSSDYETENKDLMINETIGYTDYIKGIKLSTIVILPLIISAMDGN